MIRLIQSKSGCGCGGTLEPVEEAKAVDPSETVIQTTSRPADSTDGGCCGGDGSCCGGDGTCC